MHPNFIKPMQSTGKVLQGDAGPKSRLVQGKPQAILSWAILVSYILQAKKIGDQKRRKKKNLPYHVLDWLVGLGPCAAKHEPLKLIPSSILANMICAIFPVCLVVYSLPPC
jgi:hypothetical protein